MTRVSLIAASLAGLVALPSAALAQSETRATADISALTGYASNPFSVGGAGNGNNRGGAGYGELRVRPMVVLRTDRNTFTLAGDAQFQQYFRRYGLRDNYNARLNYLGRQSDRLTLRVGINYANVISGSSFTGAVIPDQPVLEPPLIVDDLGLFGSGNRRETVGTQGSATLLWSEVDQIDVNVSAVTTSNSRPGLAIGYDSYGGGLGYSRRLNETLRLGVRGSVNKTDYLSNADTTVYSVEGTFDARLDERWTLNGSLGVSRLERTAGAALIGSARPQTTLSGSGTLCRRTPTGQLCLGASRAVLPSSFGGARIQATVDASYNVRLDSLSSVSARSSYTDVGGSGSGNASVLPLTSSFRYWSNTVGYQRRLDDRLSLSANALYRKTYGGVFRRGADVGGSVGLNIALGRGQ